MGVEGDMDVGMGVGVGGRRGGGVDVVFLGGGLMMDV